MRYITGGYWSIISPWLCPTSRPQVVLAHQNVYPFDNSFSHNVCHSDMLCFAEKKINDFEMYFFKYSCSTTTNNNADKKGKETLIAQ